LREEKIELKRQVVGDGKIVVSEKIYTRQQAELASHRKKNKISTVREQNAEAMVPYRDDLEKIKEMIHEVNETEAAAPEVDEMEAAALSTEDFKEYLKHAVDQTKSRTTQETERRKQRTHA
jgi:hypothetical protein